MTRFEIDFEKIVLFVFMPITIDELSQKLGLSPSTVSKALNNRFDVATKTRERVLKAAQEFAYTPSATARNLRRQRTDKIGLVVNYPIHRVTDFLAELIPGMATAAEQASYNLILYTDLAGNLTKINHLCGSREVDGLLLLWPPHFDETYQLAEMMKSWNMPCVMLPRRVPHPDISFVTTDHFAGAKLLTEHLIELGHRRIGYIGRPEVFETNSDRVSGYCAALQTHDIPIDDSLIVPTDSSDPDHATDALSTFINMTNPPTAILSFTDPLAAQILKLCREQGIRVPEDLSLVGYDGILSSGLTSPALTTVRQPMPDLGRIAVESLLSLIDDAEQKAIQHILPVQLIVRDSTASPKTRS